MNPTTMAFLSGRERQSGIFSGRLRAWERSTARTRWMARIVSPNKATEKVGTLGSGGVNTGERVMKLWEHTDTDFTQASCVFFRLIKVQTFREETKRWNGSHIISPSRIIWKTTTISKTTLGDCNRLRALLREFRLPEKNRYSQITRVNKVHVKKKHFT